MCNCADEIDGKLAEYNTRLVRPIMLGSDQSYRPMIETEQVKTGRGKRKKVGFFASFCPFCGNKIEATNG